MKKYISVLITMLFMAVSVTQAQNLEISYHDKNNWDFHTIIIIKIADIQDINFENEKMTVTTADKSYSIAIESMIDAKIESEEQFIDLGLPSGLKWARWNIGATRPEEFGEYYAWGETKTKSSYTPENYKFKDNWYEAFLIEHSVIYKEGLSLTPAYDVATQKWGKDCRMPTHEDVMELFKYCTYVYAIYNGVQGRLFTGKNGNEIFLPEAGCYINGEYTNDFSTYTGLYATSSYVQSCDAWCITLRNRTTASYSWSHMYEGFSIRPVKK